MMAGRRVEWCPRRLAALLAAGMLLLAPGRGSAEDEVRERREKIAVLNLHPGTEEINFKFATHLTDKVREVVRKELPADRYLHVSREHILKMEAGWDCKESQDQCKLTVARQLRVELVVTGEVNVEEGAYLYTLRLTRVSNGEVLAVTTGPPVYNKSALPDSLAKTAVELVGALSKGRVKVSSIPAGAGVVVDRSGREACTTPCDLQLEPGEHLVDVVNEGYQPHQERIMVGEREMVQVSARLRQAGGTAEPAVASGTAVSCDKPGFDFEEVRAIRQHGDCAQMSRLLEEYKRCRKELKRGMAQARERCLETGSPADCSGETGARHAYEEEVRQYRGLVKRMRHLHCPDAPR